MNRVNLRHEDGMRSTCLKIAVFLGGLGGLVAQMLLLRELLVVFTGNELTIGVILANWLLLESVGCRILGRRAETIRSLASAFAGMNVMLPLFLMAMIYAARLIRPILGYTVGQNIGIVPVVLVSFLILLPVSLLHGALFTFSARLHAGGSESSDGTESVSAVYIHETLGTLAGGIVWTAFFSVRVHAFMAAGILLGVHAVAAALVLWPFPRCAIHRRRTIVFRALFAVVTLALLSQMRRLDRLHVDALQRQWAPQRVVAYQNSRYGNATVVGQDGHYTIFLDGVAYMSLPTPPDIALMEEFVHLPMLMHPDPRSVLVLGGGAGGLIDQIRKHPRVARIAYAELDPMILAVMDRLASPSVHRELSDPRVQVHHQDGRLHLQRSPERHDIIWVGLAGLNDLQGNRFFTYEFFRLAAVRLAEDGLLVFRLPGSLTFTSPEIQALNALVYHTVRHAFSHVRVFPGDGHNLFVASQSDSVASFSLDAFAEAVERRGLDAEIALPRHLAQKLHPGWSRWFADFIREAPLDLNRDFHPRGLLYGLSHWNLSTAPVFSRLFGFLARLRGPHVVLILALLLAGFIRLRCSHRLLPASDVPLCIATSGFAGMTFDLILIFAFQALYGVVIGWIGVLVGVFMVGAAVGAFVFSRKFFRERYSVAVLFRLDLLVAGFSLLLPFALMRLHRVFPSMGSGLLLAFLVLSFGSGFVVSAQFPVAAGLLMPQRRARFSDTAGMLYAADLVGGWLAGLAVALYILPAYGIVGAGLWAVAVKLFSLCALVIRRTNR